MLLNYFTNLHSTSANPEIVMAIVMTLVFIGISLIGGLLIATSLHLTITTLKKNRENRKQEITSNKFNPK